MKHNENKIIAGITLIVLVLIFVALSPFITIWSLNTLFYTPIPINIWTYLATLWLTGLIAGSGVRSK